MKRYAVIVAGGTGSRFGSAIPKQFLPMAGLPVLMHTINHFAECGAKILLVLPSVQQEYWRELCKEYAFEVEHEVVSGGDSRFASVKNALATIDAAEGDVVAVHDGVRPLVPKSVIDDAFASAAKNGSAVPVVKVSDSIRHINPDGTSCAMRRDELVAVQTPQAFDAVALKKTYCVEFSSCFTDDASVYESAGHKICLIDGDVNNIKITHPNDIVIAENLLKYGKTR